MTRSATICLLTLALLALPVAPAVAAPPDYGRPMPWPPICLKPNLVVTNACIIEGSGDVTQTAYLVATVSNTGLASAGSSLLLTQVYIDGKKSNLVALGFHPIGPGQSRTRGFAIGTVLANHTQKYVIDLWADGGGLNGKDSFGTVDESNEYDNGYLAMIYQ